MCSEESITTQAGKKIDGYVLASALSRRGKEYCIISYARGKPLFHECHQS